METTIVKFTEQQIQDLDDQMYEIVSDRCLQLDRTWVKDDCEVEIDGVLYTVEYEGNYETGETRAADYWYGPAEYDECCNYKVTACYTFDKETDERIDVETGRESGYTF